MFVGILDSSTDALFNISMSARTCYSSREKYKLEAREDFIRGLIKSGHTSTLEFADIIFDIQGISRSCSHQLVRHRLASYAQQSQRYVNQEENQYTIPPEIEKNKEAKELYEKTIQTCKDAYKKLINAGIKKEDARFLLPEAMHTNIVVKMNIRSLRNFLSLRLDSHAQWEIRELATKMAQILVRKGWKVLIEDILKEKGLDF